MKHFTKQKSCRPYLYVSNIERVETDPIVQNGLAISPSQMLELSHQGFAISAQNARMLQEVSSPGVGVVPLEFTRHFDMADGYQAMREVHSKARKAVDALRNGDILPFDTKVKPLNLD